MTGEVCGEDAAEVGLGRAVRGAVVGGQVEVSDADVEGPPADLALRLPAAVISEVVPQPERARGQQQTAVTTSAIGHRLVTGRLGDVRHELDNRPLDQMRGARSAAVQKPG